MENDKTKGCIDMDVLKQ